MFGHDYKYEMQMLAEEAAERKYGRDFYDLPSETQYIMFRRAEETWCENAMAEAESQADRLAGN